MTTSWAATPLPSRRFLLAWVVPPAYVLALTMAVMAASGGEIKQQPTAAPAALHVAGKRRLPALRHAPRRHLRVHHHRTARRAAAPVAKRTPVTRVVSAVEVSRSSYRSAPVPQPTPDLVIRIATVATPDTMQEAINACQGPVEIDWAREPWRWGLHPSEIAEHDYCGGSSFRALTTGQRVQVIGGDLGGFYVVDGNRRYAAAGSSAALLDGIGDIAVQTCVPGGVILIGLERVS